MNREKEYLEDLDHYDEGMGIHSSSYKLCVERLKRLAKLETKLTRWLELLETDGIDSKNMVANDIQHILEEIGK